MQTSARRGIQYPDPNRDDRPDVPTHLGNLVSALEQDVVFQQGADGDRAATAHYSNGGRLWWSTDIQALWYDDGNNWTQIAGASQLLPTGVPVPFAGAVAPAGYLLCDGSPVSRTAYVNLFAVIGTTFGNGDGSSTFNVPDLRGRVPVGKNNGTFNVLGKTGGEETHVLTEGELASHNHGGTTGATSAGTPSGSVTVAGSGVLTTGTESNDHTHAGVTGVENSSHSHTYNQPALLAAAASGPEIVAVSGQTANTSTESANHTHNFTTGGRSAVHTHTVASHIHTATFAGNALATHTHSISSDGNNTAHNNLQPYIVLNYIIKT